MAYSSPPFADEVNAILWHHQIDLGNGVITPGLDKSQKKFDALNLPDNLSAKTVLDIGAWDGFFSFACEARGASVTASDHYCWGSSGHFNKKGFDLAKRILRSQIKEVFVRVEDITIDRVGGIFDIVLFLGVLYHAPDPLGYLKRVRAVTAGLAIIETHVDLLEIDRPAMAYYPGCSLNGDGSNFFGPNEAAVIGMCQDAGFTRIEVVNRDFAPDRRIFHAFV